MTESSPSPVKKHAIITFEPLDDPETGRKSSPFSTGGHGRYASGPSAELQRQQRKRLLYHILGWLVVLVMIALAVLLVYYLIGRT